MYTFLCVFLTIKTHTPPVLYSHLNEQAELRQLCVCRHKQNASYNKARQMSLGIYSRGTLKRSQKNHQ